MDKKAYQIGEAYMDYDCDIRYKLRKRVYRNLDKAIAECKRLNNKIEGFTGKSMDLEETYVCDNCSTKFRVTATVKFKSVEVAKHDMSRAYVTPLFEDKITMYEGD